MYIYINICIYMIYINIYIYPPPRHVQHFVFEHVFNDAKGFFVVGGGPDGHGTLLVYAGRGLVRQAEVYLGGGPDGQGTLL